MTDSTTETRCPACHTVFAVEAEDLARAGGKVRCGECMHVFDAMAHATTPEAPQDAADEPEEMAVDHEADDDATTDETPTTGTTETAFDVGEDHAANIDDEQFTATNWFIVDEAGDLAPIDATTNDAEAPEDEGELVFGSDQAPDPDDSGAFRFGDDTPPDTLRAELAALVGEALVEEDDNEDEEEDGIAALSHTDTETDADPVAEHEAPVATETSELEPEGDWDDLLGELDGALEAGGDVDLDFELVDADEAGNETSVDLDLTRATGQTAQPDFELPDDALMSATSISTPALSIPAVDSADPGAALTLEGEAETEAESALSLDAAADEGPSEITLEADSDDVSALTLASETPEELTLEAGGAPEVEIEPEPEPEPEPELELETQPESEPAPEPEPEAPSALELEVASAERALDAAADDAFDAGALDDLMAAAEALDADDLALEAEAVVDGDATDDEPPANEEAQPIADGAVDEDRLETGTVGEDTINAMADGERGEVIVLGGEDTPAPKVASAASELVIDTPATPTEDPEDDPSFAESMIVSPDLAPKAPRRTGLWLTLSLVALIGLAAQTVHTWRNTLVTQPYFEDVLPTVYGTLGLDLTPAWDIRQWCVETSGALAIEAGLDVESVFSNRGDSALPPPVVKVRIVDAYSDTLAATVIAPRDYLTGAVPERVAPGGRITALARLDYNEPRLDGYEVSLCYAGEGGALRCGTGCPGND
ncbi:MAG: DUF3426 domain-containing protein [Pseudomonadota bacterium]